MKTKIIISLLSILVVAWSCDDFLDIRPEATVPSSGLDYSKSENIFLPVSAAYAKLRTYGTHSFPYIGAFEITSDNADKGSTPEDNPTMKALDDLSYDPVNGIINELWVGYFDVVSAANHAIHQMPLFEEALLNADYKAYTRQCAGEAKFIRAYAYFNLTRLYGRVPVIDTTLTAEQLAAVPQSSTLTLYNFIEQDLTDAISVLPESYGKEWAGRINKFTAMALKAKVHMYQNEWDSVSSLTDRIIASDRYELLPDFRSVFSVEEENSKESLFEIQSSTLGKTTGAETFLSYAYVQGPRGNSPGNMQGWGFCTPSTDLINFFATRGETVRADATFLYRGTKTPEGDSIKMACSNPVYNGKVYTPSSQNIWNYNGYGFDHNVRILRYSDVLLMFAEARLQGATVSVISGYDAAQALNEVRERAKLTTIASPTLQDVWDERRAELAMEQDRFFDLVRTGQATTALAGKGYNPAKHNLFPIPAQQMQLNTNLTQNPNYN